MVAKRVGVDIGATAIRVAQIQGVDSDSLARIRKAAIVPLPPGCVVAGRIMDANAVAFTLQKALKKAGVPGYGIVVGVSSPESAIASLKMPSAVKPSEWVSSLLLQGKSISPRVDLRDSALSLFEVSNDDEALLRTLLAAATAAAEVDAISQAVRAAKASPRAIDLSGAATMRALVRTLPGNSDVVTVIDIGASKVTVVTRAGLYLRSVRTIESGGEDITRAIMGATDEPFDIAEHRKRGLRLMDSAPAASSAPAPAMYGGVTETRVHAVPANTNIAQEALRVSAEQLVEAITAVVESESAQFPHAPSQGLVLTGGGALLQGIKEALSSRTGLPAVLGSPWSVFTSSKGASSVLEEMDEPSAMVALATAVGLALWGVK